MKRYLSSLLFFVLLSLFISFCNGKAAVSKVIRSTRQKGSPEFDQWFEIQSQESPYLLEKANLNSLKLVQVLFRHGARSPFVSYPNDPNADYDYGVNGPGELTRDGKEQGLALGTYLRERYDGFLSSEYSSNEVYAQSSEVDRTILTSEMVLAGIFPLTPPGGHGKNVAILDSLHWQPIPLRTIPASIDNKLRGEHCPRYTKVYDDYIKGNEFMKIQEENRPVYEYVQEQIGIDKNDYDRVIYLADTLGVQALNGLPLPNWTEPIFPTKLNRIFDMILTTNTSTPELSRFKVGPILAQLVQNVEMAIGGSPSSSWTQEDLKFYHFRPAKTYLFGAHDITTGPLMNAFHVYDGDQPPCTSALILELHEVAGKTNSNNEEDYTVKMLYKKVRDQPIIELKLPECPEPCTFSNFKAKYKQMIVGDGQWVKECGFKSFGS